MEHKNYVETYNRDRNVIDFNESQGSLAFGDSSTKDDELAVNLEAEEKVTPFVIFLTVGLLYNTYSILTSI